MLEIKNIKKEYVTKELSQVALDDVTISFRKNEFVAILGPSGSGKTTLLNIIGGLDRYDSGDLVINEISTKKYKDKDWDNYRNHRVGFIFQSYNLITHQSLLKNVELALTLSGISKSERTRRAKQALIDVGLEKHMKKRPNQLSGGQMQRVAIARALVNNPDIILADEPTGALDSKTSEQIMDLLLSVAKDKLVIMVTHNPELANEYSNRIIKLSDGKVVSDSNPYNGSENTADKMLKKEKTSMSMLTALGLSLNNLMTKKGRTFLTAFAGSIGIIGIALILSLSNGVQEYIDQTQKEALANYPLQIERETVDIASMMNAYQNIEEVKCNEKSICSYNDLTLNPVSSGLLNTSKNNLKDFKKFLDTNKEINDYVSDIKYSYDIDLQIYSADTKNIIQVNPYTLFDYSSNTYNSSSFYELINNDELIESSYEVLSGRLPKKSNELILIVDENYQIPETLLYNLNLVDRSKFNELFVDMQKDDYTFKSNNYSYDEFLNTKYKLILNTDYYTLENGKYIDNKNNISYMRNIINKGYELEIVGIVKAKDKNVLGVGRIGYLHSLVTETIDRINNTDIAKKQINNKNINIFTNESFDNINTKYEDNAKKLGIVDVNNPKVINIYPKNFEAKERISELIDNYNSSQDEENRITYTDLVGVLLSSVTSIVNVISYILIAFVAVSLVVSSIMIAIITYISVLERTKEIGILRSIGASKKDVSRVFRAETIIEGFIAGLFGVVVAYLLTLVVNKIVLNVLDVANIAKLPFVAAIILIIISVLLTLLAGAIPARMASKKDPVESLRSE